MSDGPSLNPDLFHANLALFAQNVSHDLAFKLAAVRTDLEAAYVEGGSNILSGEKRLYPETAEAFAAGQISAYMRNPQTLTLMPGAERVPETGPPLHLQVLERLQRHAGALSSQRDPEVEAGFLVSFGVGLGVHLKPLLQQLPFRHLVLVDETLGFLALSLHVVNWAEIFNALGDRGGRLHVLTAQAWDRDGDAFDDPLLFSNKIFNLLRDTDQVLLDGSHLFAHHRTQYIDEVIRHFVTSLPSIGDSDGFFEDELLMLEGALGNLGGGPVRVLAPGQTLDDEHSVKPAIIVGSGPSIENDLDAIRQLRDGVTLISGGTGLGVMLEAGLTPDYHCEIENTSDILRVNKATAAKHDLSTVTLIASTTVNPDVAGLFAGVVYVFRDQLTPTRLFAPDNLVLPMAGPTVTHLACRAAIALGIPELYLFGVDLGAVDPDHHHAAGSIYETSEDPYWQGGAAMEKLSIPVAGNFRPQVYSSRTFAFARLFFSTLVHLSPDTTIYNCSDGVLIDGTLPMRGAAIKLKEESVPVGTEAISTFHLSEADIGPRIAALREALIEISEGMNRAEPAQTFKDIYAPLRPYLNWRIEAERLGGHASHPRAGTTDPRSSEYWIACFMLTGSLTMVLQAANGYAARLPAARRAPFVEEVHGALQWLVGEAIDMCDKTFAQMP